MTGAPVTTPTRIERHQVWVYVACVVAGLALGTAVPAVAALLGVLVWPALAVLLAVTFLQVPLRGLPEALKDVRFVSAVVTGNFLVLPVVVWLILPLVGDDPALRAGVLLVLLVPCTDWFLTFTHLSGGDTRRALAVTPVNLLLQLALLPALVWVVLDGSPSAPSVDVTGPLVAFAGVVLGPLAVSWAVQEVERRRRPRVPLAERVRVLPVVMLALVVLLVAASQVSLVTATIGVLGRLLAVFVAFLVAALAVGLAIARVLALTPGASRALVFSLSTRNSFVVLPLALAMPAGFEVAAVVVVLQSLVELFGMIIWLRVVPGLTAR